MERDPADLPNDTEDDLVVYELSSDCTVSDVEPDTPYVATVNGVVDFGVFVDLSDTVSGLIHDSVLYESLSVNDETVVRLNEIRDNGDLSFVPVDVEDEYRIERIEHAYELTSSDVLEDRINEEVHIEGEIVQIKQTGGPTVFHVSDERGIVSCTAFDEAGVRTYPEVEIGSYVRIRGTPERHNGGMQVEIERLTQLDGDDERAVAERIDDAHTRRSEVKPQDPLIEWEAFESLRPDLRGVAETIRRAVLSGRPVRIRHHADGDGMCAAVPVQLSLQRFISRIHWDPEAANHMVKRFPSKAPFYEMEDATRDLNFALEDRERHGQKLPLVLMLDNGSTAEDVPAYETLANYDIPIIVIDHHHPDPDAMGSFVESHVNPYLYGEDYRITTGMMCVELARMIDPAISEEIEHLPAVAGVADRSKADAMDRYFALAARHGYDESRIAAVSEALDYAAFWLRYNSGDAYITDILGIETDEAHHRELVSFLAKQSRKTVDQQLDVAMPHLEHDVLANGAHLFQIDVDDHVFRHTYPAPGKTTGEIHDRKVNETGDPVITVGIGPDFAVLRSDRVRLDIPEMVAELDEEIDGAGVSGGGHLVVGSIKFVRGRRDEVIEALIEKMAVADIDETLSTTHPLDQPS